MTAQAKNPNWHIGEQSDAVSLSVRPPLAGLSTVAEPDGGGKCVDDFSGSMNLNGENNSRASLHRCRVRNPLPVVRGDEVHLLVANLLANTAAGPRWPGCQP